MKAFSDLTPQNKKKLVVVGITGGIAAYKSAELVRNLIKRGHRVKVIMTRNAQQFIGPTTFKALTSDSVITEMFNESAEAVLRHTELADQASCVVIAPATANLIGKYANGIADDFLTTFLLANPSPVVIAPAMNPRMYASTAVQKNIEILKQRGVFWIGPDSGDTACGHQGVGRMSHPDEITDITAAVLGQKGDYAGKKVLVTAGPTREMIDPVRFISNRSSGLMGYSIAAAAVERGAFVHLISGPSSIRPHAAVKLSMVTSAQEMADRTLAEWEDADVAIMTAAVSDWQPMECLPAKRKKNTDLVWNLSLKNTIDILEEAGKRKKTGQLLFGFAAETENLQANAKIKITQKRLDGIFANDVSGSERGFEAPHNGGYFISSSGDVLEFPVESKRALADKLLNVLFK